MNAKSGYGRFIKWGLLLMDVVLYNIIFFSMHAVLQSDHQINIYLVTYLSVTMAAVSAFFIKVHELRVLYADRIAVKALQATAIHAVLYVIGCLMLQHELDWKLFLAIYGVLLVALTLWWICSRKLLKYIRSIGFNYKRIVIVGSGTSARQLVDEFQSDLGYGYRIQGYFDKDNSQESTIDAPYLGDIDALEEYIASNSLDEIYYEQSSRNDDALVKVMNIADVNAVDFFYIPMLGVASVRPMEVITMGKSLVLSLRPTPLSYPLNATIKRLFDILVSSFVLIFSPIVLIPVAIGVKLSSKGPIFFKQERTGYRGKSFNCYKFRSMRVNDESDSKQATGSDPRKTKFGEFLRKTSIDELPQFYNVWKGDMSIVGPRPHMLAHTEMYGKMIDKYMMRHTVKPGITGWAQVRGFRGPTPELWMMEKRVEYDVWYAENWSFMLDLKIIILTVINVFRGDKNAV